MPGYASIVQLSKPSERVDSAAKLKDGRWQASKLRVYDDAIAGVIATMSAVRDTVGDSTTIVVDVSQAQSADN